MEFAHMSLIASMGPRLLSRGEMLVTVNVVPAKTLQWGRGFSAAESPPASSGPGHIVGFNGAAASQPRREYLRNFNERKGLNRILRPAHSTLLLNAVVSPMQNS